MKRSKRNILLAVGIIVVLLLGCGGYLLVHAATVGAGYTAKILCSAVFISQRVPESVLSEDLSSVFLKPVDAEVDHETKSVTTTALGVVKRRAVYREGLGCTLLAGTSEEQIRSQVTGDLTPMPPNQQDLPWPTGDMGAKGDLPSGVDAQKLEDALDEAFSEPDPKRRRGTRAVVVVYEGHIIAERYAPGFNEEMPLIGWSMTKSVTNALVGILVGQGKLSIEEPAPVPEWSKPDDPRRAITLDQLCRMSSGLEWNEGLTDLTALFFGSACSDVAAYAANKPLKKEPDSTWNYSSGTANIIARIIRYAVGGTQADYFAFPRRALFDKIGMRSAVMEPDASGTFVGSSFMYATARDWARFGLLYLNDGVWEGERILPEGWVTYSSTPTPSAPRGEYGALFWTIGRSAEGADEARIPSDAYSALGYEAQSVTIIPSRNLVIVRLGLSQPEDARDLESLLLNLLKAIQK